MKNPKRAGQALILLWLISVAYSRIARSFEIFALRGDWWDITRVMIEQGDEGARVLGFIASFFHSATWLFPGWHYVGFAILALGVMLYFGSKK
jgi:hypothetical protein